MNDVQGEVSYSILDQKRRGWASKNLWSTSGRQSGRYFSKSKLDRNGIFNGVGDFPNRQSSGNFKVDIAIFHLNLAESVDFGGLFKGIWGSLVVCRCLETCVGRGICKLPVRFVECANISLLLQEFTMTREKGMNNEMGCLWLLA
jgi:hypothetical protein